jgi:hypothetical protein
VRQPAVGDKLINWPKHKCSLYLTHNDHLCGYETVQDYIDQERYDYKDWISEEQKQKAIKTNDCWTLHWYPDTPVGFYTMAAADLDKLLEYCSDSKNFT